MTKGRPAALISRRILSRPSNRYNLIFRTIEGLEGIPVRGAAPVRRDSVPPSGASHAGAIRDVSEALATSPLCNPPTSRPGSRSEGANIRID